MAEVIGLISAIGGIAAAGIKVAKVVYALADELGTAGKQVRTLAADTRALSWVLKELNGRLQRMSSIPRDGIKVAHDAAMLIKDEIDGIGEIVKPLISEEGQRMSKKQKAKWIFTKSQITTRQTALNSHKATLSLVLDTLKLIEGQTDAEGLEEEIEHAESEVKHIKTNFEDAERTDLVLEKAYCALQVHTQQKTLQTTAGGGNEQQIVLHGTTSEDVENHDSNALVTLTALISHLDSNNEDTASEAAHQLFLKRHLAIVLYEDIHRRAVSFATSTLHQRQHPGLSRETDRETSEPRRFLEPEDGFRASPPPPPGLKQSLDREFMTVPLDDPFGGTANRLDPYRQDYLRSTRRPSSQHLGGSSQAFHYGSSNMDHSHHHTIDPYGSLRGLDRSPPTTNPTRRDTHGRRENGPRHRRRGAEPLTQQPSNAQGYRIDHENNSHGSEHRSKHVTPSNIGLGAGSVYGQPSNPGYYQPDFTQGVTASSYGGPAPVHASQRPPIGPSPVYNSRPPDPTSDYASESSSDRQKNVRRPQVFNDSDGTTAKQRTKRTVHDHAYDSSPSARSFRQKHEQIEELREAATRYIESKRRPVPPLTVEQLEAHEYRTRHEAT